MHEARWLCFAQHAVRTRDARAERPQCRSASTPGNKFDPICVTSRRSSLPPAAAVSVARVLHSLRSSSCAASSIGPEGKHQKVEQAYQSDATFQCKPQAASMHVNWHRCPLTVPVLDVQVTWLPAFPRRPSFLLVFTGSRTKADTKRQLRSCRL